MTKIVHVITGLSRGGAEMMLLKLASRVDRSRYRFEVISLTDIGALGAELARCGVTVSALGMRRGVPNPLVLPRLVGSLRAAEPDIVQTWMYHADLLGGFAARLAGAFPVIWGVRQSDLHPARSARMTRWTARACAALSHWIPTRIVSCSEVARDVHVGLGYAREKFVVIPNGFEVDRFKPDRSLRQRAREELGIGDSARVVGMVARFDPQKDHRTFIEAARTLLDEVSDAQFVLCGRGIDWRNGELAACIGGAASRASFHLLGEREEMERLLPAFDVLCLSSAYGEGFPNVIGEAMACAVPCVATDVGDSAQIIGDTGAAVPPADASALARALARVLSRAPEERMRLGAAARARIVETFEIGAVVRRFETLYRDLLK